MQHLFLILLGYSLYTANGLAIVFDTMPKQYKSLPAHRFPLLHFDKSKNSPWKLQVAYPAPWLIATAVMIPMQFLYIFLLRQHTWTLIQDKFLCKTHTSVTTAAEFTKFVQALQQEPTLVPQATPTASCLSKPKLLPQVTTTASCLLPATI
jgi:hypothetical protein